jgi:FecR protein
VPVQGWFEVGEHMLTSSWSDLGLKFANTVAIGAVLAGAFLVVPASAESKARIVRLSEVQGTVQIDRSGGDGFGKAFINLPVIEGSRVKTGNDGRAEVEFEDGSTLRLAPGTQIDFVRLSLGDDGNKLNTVHLDSGMLYANVHLKKARDKGGDQFLVNFANESVAVPEAAHFRLQLEAANKATLAVFKGKCSAILPSAQFDVPEKHGATIKLAQNAASGDDDPAKSKDTFVMAKKYESEPADAWDRQQAEFRDRNASTAASASLSLPYAYGMSDLNYYGNFMNVAGYGNVWQPYFAGANWSPFQDGAWAFYPGAGYMWVSGYPWGWMPYRYGNWAFMSGIGWFWQPGFTNSYYAFPQVLNAPAAAKIPVAPATGHQTVMVGRGLSANPPADTMRVLTINPGSAGFGVPRGSIDHLNHIAKKVDHTSRPAIVATTPPISTVPSTGFATTPLSPTAAAHSGAVGVPHHPTSTSTRPH